jgi:5-methylcytosine-specific restriction endonuclease McrA
MGINGSNILSQHVLVLNKHWIAVHVCSVRRALSLVFQELAHIVSDNYQTHDFSSWRNFTHAHRNGTPVIHTTNFSMMIPQVIVLSCYSRIPPRSLKFNRRNIFLRDRHTCQYCGVTFGHAELTIDHVIPRSRGGDTDWNNLVVACTRCNTRKGNMLPQEIDMIPSRKPRKPSWVSTLRLQPVGLSTPNLWNQFLKVSQMDLQPAEE